MHSRTISSRSDTHQSFFARASSSKAQEVRGHGSRHSTCVFLENDVNFQILFELLAKGGTAQ
ncbi:hypothetical protein YC2023_116353 [Brassica napus]